MLYGSGVGTVAAVAALAATLFRPSCGAVWPLHFKFASYAYVWGTRTSSRLLVSCLTYLILQPHPAL